MQIFRYSLFVMLLTLCSCWAPRIDEKYAASVVKKELSLSGNVSAQELKGGSDAKIFLATDGVKKYVVRFPRKGPACDSEIYNLKVASDGGYGPQIYFADCSQGIVIMEYLSCKAISDQELFGYIASKTIAGQDLLSDQFYVALAHLLQKIHHGKAFESNWSGIYIFKRIDRFLQINKPKYGSYVPLTKIEQIVTVIHRALLPHLITTVPCHNDLHRDNLFLCGKECKAIDYETAGPGDPFFDIATVAASFFARPAHEKVLFTTYLGRQPTEAEQAKLYLMKQAICIKWCLDGLRGLSPEMVRQYGMIKASTFIEIVNAALDGKIVMNKPENKLKFLKAWLNQLFENFESQECRDAVRMLSEVKKFEKNKPHP